jgi:hypothetical protein
VAVAVAVGDAVADAETDAAVVPEVTDSEVPPVPRAVASSVTRNARSMRVCRKRRNRVVSVYVPCSSTVTGIATTAGPLAEAGVSVVAVDGVTDVSVTPAVSARPDSERTRSATSAAGGSSARILASSARLAGRSPNWSRSSLIFACSVTLVDSASTRRSSRFAASDRRGATRTNQVATRTITHTRPVTALQRAVRVESISSPSGRIGARGHRRSG